MSPAGWTINAIAYCTHRRDGGCACRKPRTGLFDAIVSQFGSVDLEQSWMVGDKESDIGFGQAVGERTVLIRSRYCDLDTLKTKPNLITGSLLEFARTHLNRP